jgi:hypothetical protein
MTVQLDMSQIRGLTPSFVHTVENKATSAMSSDSKSQQEVTEPAMAETSVRHFLRLVVWTDPEDKVCGGGGGAGCGVWGGGVWGQCLDSVTGCSGGWSYGLGLGFPAYV